VFHVKHSGIGQGKQGIGRQGITKAGDIEAALLVLLPAPPKKRAILGTPGPEGLTALKVEPAG
jgi:hypothetical protein